MKQFLTNYKNSFLKKSDYKLIIKTSLRYFTAAHKLIVTLLPVFD